MARRTKCVDRTFVAADGSTVEMYDDEYEEKRKCGCIIVPLGWDEFVLRFCFIHESGFATTEEARRIGAEAATDYFYTRSH